MKLLLCTAVIVLLLPFGFSQDNCEDICEDITCEEDCNCVPECCVVDQACTPNCCDYICDEECTSIYCCETSWPFDCGYNCGTCTDKYCSHCDADDCGEECEDITSCDAAACGETCEKCPYVCGEDCETVCAPTSTPTNKPKPEPTDKPTPRPPEPTNKPTREPTEEPRVDPTQQTTAMPAINDEHAAPPTIPTPTSTTGNDLCGAAVGPLTPGTITAGSTLGATPDAVPACGSATAGTFPGVWYTVKGTGEMLTASTCTGTELDSGYKSQLSIWQGTCASPQCVAGNDNDPSCDNESSVSWPTISDQMYFILVHGQTATAGTFGITVTVASADDSTSSAQGKVEDSRAWSLPQSSLFACMSLGVGYFLLV